MAAALQNKILDKYADHIYTDVKGQLTNENDPNLFDAELLPGEAIVREFRTFAVIKREPMWFYYLKVIMTVGLYWVYVNFLSCCRSKSLGHTKTRLAFTNKGRLLMWNAVTAGGQSAGFCPSTAFNSRTTIRSFHAKDINSVQVSANRYPKCWGIHKCFGEEHFTHMRLYVGRKYPQDASLARLGSMDPRTLLPGSKPDWDRVRFLSGRGGFGEESSGSSLMDFVSFIFSTVTAYLSILQAYVSDIVREVSGGAVIGSSNRGDMIIHLKSLNGSFDYDGYHKDFEDGWRDLSDLVQFVLFIKGAQHTLNKVEPRNGNFVVEHSDSMSDAYESRLVRDDTIYVNTTKIPLGPDEKVIDALPIKPQMSWFEFFCVPCICCRRKFRTKAAMVMTSSRLITASEFRPLRPGPDYEFYMAAYFIGKLESGFFIHDPKGDLGYTTEVETKHGAVRVDPVISGTWPWTKRYATELKPRMFAFCQALELSCECKQAIPAPMQGTIPNQNDVNLARNKIRLFKGEEICSVLRSKDLYNLDDYLDNLCLMACAYGDPVCLVGIVKCLTCKRRPWRLDQLLILTTHRVLSYQAVVNDCSISCFKGNQELFMWAPLKEVDGFSMTGIMSSRPANCFDRQCQKCCPCVNKDAAAVGVQMGLNSNFDTIPFSVGKLQNRATEGIIESNQELLHFRAAYAFYQSTRTTDTDKMQSIKPAIHEKYNTAPLPDYLSDVKIDNPARSG